MPIKTIISLQQIETSTFLNNDVKQLWCPGSSINKNLYTTNKWKQIYLFKYQKYTLSQVGVNKGLKHFNLLKEQVSYKLIRCVFTKGDFLKIYKIFLKSISQIYKLIAYDQVYQIQQRFSGYSPMLNYLTCAFTMFNINVFLLWIARSLAQVFVLKCFSTNKFFKKKHKIKFNMKLVYVTKQFRLSNAIKRFALLIETQKYYKLSTRFFFALSDICFLYKKGTFYKRKLLTYKRALTSLQKK